MSFTNLVMKLLKEEFTMNSISKESVSDIFSILSDKPNFSNLSEIFDLE